MSYRRLGQGTPTVTYLQSVNIDVNTHFPWLRYAENKAPQAVVVHLTSEPAPQPKGPQSPRDNSADQPLLYAARSHV